MVVSGESTVPVSPSVTTWQKLALLLGKWLFTILLATQLAALVWMIVAPEPLTLMAPTQGSGSTQASGIRGTGQYHLFGIATNEPVKVQTKVVDAPVTRLRLRLLGINKSSVAEQSSAIIAPQSGAGDFYRIGDTIQGRTKLAGVDHDKVVLDTNGKLETLKFEEAKRSGINARSVAAPKVPVRKGGSLRERFGKIRSASEFMSLATEEMSQNPRAALNELGLQSAGSGQGYRVQSGSMLTRLQLKAGDIVLSVNGQRLGDIEVDKVLLEQLATSGNARIEVQRGNNRFVVNHKLN